MDLSVVMPSFNSARTIAAQLMALMRQEWCGNWEVVVADNGSTDDTRAIVERYCQKFSRVRLVDASARRGAAHARNTGARAALGELLAFCDADDEIAPGWVAAMARALASHEFVASRMDVDKLNPPWIAKSLNNVQGRELRRAFYPPYFKHAGSSGMGIRRALHDAIGGFDESLAQREDTDYCFRLQVCGVELVLAAEALIHVRYRDNAAASFRQARQWGYYYVLLYKRYNRGPMPGNCWRSHLQIWRDLVLSVTRLCSSDTRTAYMKALGTQVGLLHGALRFCAPPVCEPATASARSAAATQSSMTT